METQTPSLQVEGFILELYCHGVDQPFYVSNFDENAEAGFSGYSENRESAVVFQSREALLPLASIEVEAVTEESGQELSAYDGFRILPYRGPAKTQFVTAPELEAALMAFEGE